LAKKLRAIGLQTVRVQKEIVTPARRKVTDCNRYEVSAPEPPLAVKPSEKVRYKEIPNRAWLELRGYGHRDGHAEIPIEERSGEELKYVSGTTSEGRADTVSIAPKQTPAANYAFDVTPARLVDALITERGIIQPTESAILGLYPEYR
jgi:hypothetical protein